MNINFQVSAISDRNEEIMNYGNYFNSNTLNNLKESFKFLIGMLVSREIKTPFLFIIYLTT